MLLCLVVSLMMIRQFRACLYGLTITKKAFISATDNNNLLSGNLLNRKEFSDGKGLNWYDMNARMYDPQIGRWHSADPLSENAVNWSSYRYAFDNPVGFTDTSGLWETDPGQEVVAS